MGADIYDLIEKLDLERANTGDYFGEIAGQPAILSILSLQPPGMLVKIRINSEDVQGIEVSENLFDLVEKETINISVENGYGWLTIYNLSEFKTEEVIGLLEDFAWDVDEHRLTIGAGCAMCKNATEIETYYSDGKVNRLCPVCLAKKTKQQEERNKKLFEIKASSVWLTLLGMMGFIVAWTAMWLLYDYMFVLYGRDEIEVSDYVLIAGVFVAVGILAGSIGLPLRRFGIQNSRLLAVVASVLVFISFVLGEILTAIIWIFQEIKSVDVINGVKYFIFLWQGEATMYKAVKIGLVAGAIIGIYMIAKNKKVALEV